MFAIPTNNWQVCQQISLWPWFTATAILLKTLATAILSKWWNIEQQLIEAINQLNLQTSWKQIQLNNDLDGDWFQT